MKRYTTYISNRHLQILKKLASEKRLPVCNLLGLALDKFLQEIDRLPAPEFAPIKEAYLRPTGDRMVLEEASEIAKRKTRTAVLDQKERQASTKKLQRV
jgi:hypothetical protein